MGEFCLMKNLFRRIKWIVSDFFDANLVVVPFLIIFIVFAFCVLFKLEKLNTDVFYLNKNIYSSSKLLRANRPNDGKKTIVHNFEEAFPDDDQDVNALLQNLFEIAKECNLALNDGEYSSDNSQAKYWGRYIISFPVRGDAKSVEQFVARVLHDEPAISMSSLNLSRNNITTGQVDANLVFVFHYRK